MDLLIYLKKLKEFSLENSKSLEQLDAKGQKNIFYMYQLFLYTNQSVSLIDEMIAELESKKEG